jgi:hypothetical protein
MKIRWLTLVLLIGLIAIPVGCGKNTPSVPESPVLMSSPLPLDAGVSPLATPVPPHVDAFRLDKPIKAGATQVTGQGPAGVPIILQDITFVGPVLAAGTIGSDGRFTLELDTPLEADHRIGLTLGNLSGTQWQHSDFSSAYYGDEARSVPQVGFFFDTAMVRE